MAKDSWEKDKQAVRESYVKRTDGYKLVIGVTATEDWWLNIYKRTQRWKFGPMTSRAFAMEEGARLFDEVKLGKWPPVQWSKSRGYYQPPKYSAALAGSK